MDYVAKANTSNPLISLTRFLSLLMITNKQTKIQSLFLDIQYEILPHNTSLFISREPLSAYAIIHSIGSTLSANLSTS
jgi:hypothetical protein